jgi:hypothetical protein
MRTPWVGPAYGLVVLIVAVTWVQFADGLESGLWRWLPPFVLLCEVRQEGASRLFGGACRRHSSREFRADSWPGGVMIVWPNRDPIGEKGGANLYACLGNDPVGKADLLGQGQWTLTIDPGETEDLATFLFPGPVIKVSYMVDDGQAKCCKEYEIRRYARQRIIGALIPGWWRRDDIGYEPTIGNVLSHIPTSAYPDQPGFRLPLLGWVAPLVANFRWEVWCITGASAGTKLTELEETVVILHNGGEWVGYSGQGTVIIND